MSDLCLDSLSDAAATRARLAARGLGGAAAEAKAERFARCARALAGAGAAPDGAAHAFFVPGRIEVLGKHTDYAGGRSIVAAAERGFCLVAVPRGDSGVRAFALDLDDACEFAFSADLAPTVGHWSNYPMTVARRLAKNFPGRLRGADVAFSSDLPSAAGMSSSSALMVATFLALSAVNRLGERPAYRANIAGPESLAEYLGTVENGQTFGTLAGDKGVGTFGGSEDHTAMLCSRPGHLIQYAYCPTRPERRIAVPRGCVFAIAASGIAAEKTGRAMAQYNRASRLASAVAEAWRQATGRPDVTIADALASAGAAGDGAEAMRRVLAARPAGGPFSAAELLARFEHFLAESVEIVPAAGDALAAGDLEAFGHQVDRSQQVAETLLGNQVPQTVFLARAGRELGASAASGFGAGFGGSVWALVRDADAPAMLDRWAARYREAFPAEAGQALFFLSRAGPAAFELGG